MFNPVHTWFTGEKLTSEKFNEQIEQNLAWIKNRNISILTVRNGISDYSQSTLGTYQPIDPNVFYVDITTTGGDLMITANLSLYNTGAGGGTQLTVYAQPYNGEAFFLHNLGAIGVASPISALWIEEVGSAYKFTKTYRYFWKSVPANSYRLSLWWSSLVGTSTLNFTNTVNQLIAEEFSRWTP